MNQFVMTKQLESRLFYVYGQFDVLVRGWYLLRSTSVDMYIIFFEF